MKTVTMFEKGERILMEMEIDKVTLEGGIHKYSLKVPNVEDYLDQEYTFEQLIAKNEEDTCKEQ